MHAGRGTGPVSMLERNASRLKESRYYRREPLHAPVDYNEHREGSGIELVRNTGEELLTEEHEGLRNALRDSLPKRRTLQDSNATEMRRREDLETPDILLRGPFSHLQQCNIQGGQPTYSESPKDSSAAEKQFDEGQVQIVSGKGEERRLPEKILESATLDDVNILATADLEDSHRHMVVGHYIGPDLFTKSLAGNAWASRRSREERSKPLDRVQEDEAIISAQASIQSLPLNARRYGQVCFGLGVLIGNSVMRRISHEKSNDLREAFSKLRSLESPRRMPEADEVASVYPR